MEVQRRIAEDPRVFGIYDVTGEFDSMVLARVLDRAQLDDLSKQSCPVKGLSALSHM